MGGSTGAVCATQGIITGFVPAILLIGQPSWFTIDLAIAIAGVGVALFAIFFFPVKKEVPAS